MRMYDNIRSLFIKGAGEYCSSSSWVHGCESCQGDQQNWVNTLTIAEHRSKEAH
jgi:hypothetical protein